MSDSQTTSSETEQTTTSERVGDTLRQARERAGLNIADVARGLRISQKYLEALEDSRHEDLPGTTYAIGFVRSFAEHLHMDGEEMVRRYKDEVSGVTNKNDLSFPKPISEGGVPGGAVLGLGVIIAAVAYGGWYWSSSQNEVEVARVEAVPEHLAADTVDKPVVQPVEEQAKEAMGEVEDAVENVAKEVEEAVEEVAQPVEEAVEEAAEEVVEDTPAPVEEKVEDVAEAVEEAVEPVVEKAENDVEQATEEVEEVAVEASEETEAAVEAVDVATPEPGPIAEKIEPAADPVSVTPVERENVGPSRITLRGKSNSWISVRDTVSDRLLFMRLLSKGEEYQVPNRSGLELMTGNAGELELWIDGKLLPPLGHTGEVKRNVELDADTLKATVKAEQ
ncbi:RodZ domain-containing protein [Magnetovibrio sp. PR-2]|uniref:helix-turn-helix domain-containing protein n=1 Tax=Magnetovibrio sp. PR-2 TaxID=3120356 RepID=UPI002FCE46B6